MCLQTGGVLLVTNHMSRFDTLLLAFDPHRRILPPWWPINIRKNLLFLVVLNIGRDLSGWTALRQIFELSGWQWKR